MAGKRDTPEQILHRAKNKSRQRCDRSVKDAKATYDRRIDRAEQRYDPDLLAAQQAFREATGRGTGE